MLKAEGLKIRIKILLQESKLNTSLFTAVSLFFVFILSFTCLVANLSIARAQDENASQEEMALEAKREDLIIKEILLQKKRDRKIAAQKAIAEANRQIILDRRSRIQQERAQKIIEEKIVAANKKQAALDKASQLQKEFDKKEKERAEIQTSLF